MGYKRTEHKNALFKLVREKGLILQKEAADRLNRKSDSLRITIESLVEEGKIKRQKVKQRFKNGNLNDVWLLYMPGTNQNLILNYESELINTPFESPLKEHHCYKKIDNESDNNVIEMAEYVKINENELVIKEYHGERIVTLNDIDIVHGRPKGTAKANFNRNKKHFILNEDYFVLAGDDLSRVRQTYSVHKNTTKLIVLTESGYLILVKTFTDDLSWEIQRNLVNTYFKMKKLSEKNQIQPIQKQEVQSLDILEMMIKEMKKDRERVDKLENKLDKIVEILGS